MRSSAGIGVFGLALATVLCSVGDAVAQRGASPDSLRHIQSIEPRSGPPGTPVAIHTLNMPLQARVHIGVGAVGAGFEELGRGSQGEFGEIRASVRIPASATWDKPLVLIIFNGNFSPTGISSPFHVTNAEGRILRRGRITGGSPECLTMEDEDGFPYLLSGVTEPVQRDEVVAVEGVFLETESCGGRAGDLIRVERLERGASASVDTLTVMAYNIHHGEGMDGAVDLQRIAQLIRDADPDLVALQEIDSVTTRTGGVDQASELGRLTGMRAVFGGFMPYQGGSYGMAVLSRWPVQEVVNHRLPPGAEPRTALAVRVRSPATGRDLLFVGIHFYATAEQRLAQASRLAELLQSEAGSVILAGDFNSTPGSDVMAHLAREWSILDKGDDRLTFPSYGAEREIDFVLVRSPAGFDVLSHRPLDEAVASDHRPLLAELVVRD